MITSKFKKVIAVDTSKNTFNLCVRDLATNKESFHKIRRDDFVSRVIQMATDGSVVVMESCGGSHHWARTFKNAGVAVRLIAPQHARKFLPNKRMKNDTNDAIAICRCAVQPETKFVRIKTEEESAISSTHCQRRTVISLRVASENRMRAMLQESGLVFPAGEKGPFSINTCQPAPCIRAGFLIVYTIVEKAVFSDKRANRHPPFYKEECT